jgi:DNA-binding MarR family transcriptional regulator
MYEVDSQNAKPPSGLKPELLTQSSSRSRRQKESRRYYKRSLCQFLRFDELFSLSIILQPMSKDEILEVQRLYPQIYIACHTDHIRAVSTAWRISSQDASILVHLDREAGLSPRRLASHLGVAPSTLSAAIARLSKLGYITATTNENDRRRRELRLTPRGAEAIRSTSVLDAERVRAMLGKLKPKERKEALRGLALLAEAARKLSE